MSKTSYINFGDRIILMKPMGRKFDVIGTVYEIGGITDTHYIIRDTHHRVAVGTILHNDFDTYFIKETSKKVWTDWGVILDTDGLSIAGYYRTNGKKVQVKRGKVRAEACCCKEDIFNLAIGINIALNRCIIKCCNKEIKENKDLISKYSNSSNLESKIEYLGNIKDLAETELYKVLKVINTKEIYIKDTQEKSCCKVCCNATVELELNSENDLSYISVGESIHGVNMQIRTGDNRPTSLIVSQWNKILEENVNIGIYKMKFCPECGRKLIENES